MKKIAGWGILLLLAITLTACAGSKPTMVKCPNCGSVFDINEHIIEMDKTRG